MNLADAMQHHSTSDEEIDLRSILNSFDRQRVWLIGGLSFGLLVGTIYTLRAKPIWKGEFEIVLAAKQTGLGIDNLLGSGFSQLAGLGARLGGDSELDTEVKILESPSVLLPVFEMVKQERTREGIDTSKMQFRQWAKKNLKVKLKKGTSVLQISYLDGDQGMVLPVLNKISRAYQIYSGRDRLDSIRRGIIYAEKQAAIFNQKAQQANRSLDAFSIRYGISGKSDALPTAGIDLSKLLSSGPQNRGGSVANLGADTSLSSSRSLNAQGDPLGQLATINQELIRRRQLFTDKDPIVQALERERNAMRQYIDVTGGGMIALPSTNPTSRPKVQAQELIVRYQELDREAKRTTSIADSLARSLLSLQLEQARITRPWELISQPTLLEKPVSPIAWINLLASGTAGLLLGCIAALTIEKRRDLAYSINDFQEFINYPLIARLPLKSPGDLSQSLELIVRKYLPNPDWTSTALIQVGSVIGSQELSTQLEIILKQIHPLGNVQLTTNVVVASQCAVQFLLISPGCASRDDLRMLQQKLQLQEKPIAGMLMLDHAS